MSHLVLIILSAAVMLLGLVGVLLPIFPGIPYMFIVALVFAFIDSFVNMKTGELEILGAIAVLSIFVDYLSGMVGAKIGGASKKAMIYGMAGLLLGTVLLPPFGGLLGLFLGVLIAEILNNTKSEKAIKAATSSLLGHVAGVALNLIFAIIFLILFIIFSLK